MQPMSWLSRPGGRRRRPVRARWKRTAPAPTVGFACRAVCRRGETATPASDLVCNPTTHDAGFASMKRELRQAAEGLVDVDVALGEGGEGVDGWGGVVGLVRGRQSKSNEESVEAGPGRGIADAEVALEVLHVAP